MGGRPSLALCSKNLPQHCALTRLSPLHVSHLCRTCRLLLSASPCQPAGRTPASLTCQQQQPAVQATSHPRQAAAAARTLQQQQQRACQWVGPGCTAPQAAPLAAATAAAAATSTSSSSSSSGGTAAHLHYQAWWGCLAVAAAAAAMAEGTSVLLDQALLAAMGL
jgi:hypothetical protein